MTRFHREYITCAHCLNEEEIVIWDLINIGEDPDLEEKVLLKQLQNYECQNCNHLYIIERPMLYIDPANKLLLYYSPAHTEITAAENRRADGRLSDELAAQLPQDFGVDLEGYMLRLLVSYNDLIEKIHIRKNALSDRLLETLKLAILARLNEAAAAEAAEIKDLSEEELLPVMASLEVSEIHFLGLEGDSLLFQTFSEAKGWQQLELERSVYDNAENMLRSLLPAESGWDLVDSSSAATFINFVSQAQ
ncbi:MAG: hypothetical protein GX588_05675 [Clostridiaceae bacterium]|nr:hypothetical protein [Clostridiaceae bacterium]